MNVQQKNLIFPRLSHFLVLGLLSAGLVQADSRRIERRVRVMGTELSLVVDAPDRAMALEASEAAVAALSDAEARLTTWTEESELSRVNSSPPLEEVRLSPRLARDLEAALACAHATDGAFTPGIGALVQAWGLRSGGRSPKAREIDEARAAVSPANATLTGNRLVRLHDRFVFEEGGFGKGAGLDDAMAALDLTDATGAVLDLGGQVAVWGDAISNVAMVDPRHRDRVVLRMSVSRGSIATTGNSERGIVVDGRRMGHVLDPRTGRPSLDFGSLAVWADKAATADCLATGLYVMGPEAAWSWAAGRDDVALVIIRETRRGLEALASPALEGRLTAVVNDVTLRFVGALPRGQR